MLVCWLFTKDCKCIVRWHQQSGNYSLSTLEVYQICLLQVTWTSSKLVLTVGIYQIFWISNVARFQIKNHWLETDFLDRSGVEICSIIHVISDKCIRYALYDPECLKLIFVLRFKGFDFLKVILLSDIKNQQEYTFFWLQPYWKTVLNFSRRLYNELSSCGNLNILCVSMIDKDKAPKVPVVAYSSARAHAPVSPDIDSSSVPTKSPSTTYDENLVFLKNPKVYSI